MKELPELDDEFASEVSEFDTMAEYKEDVKARLAKEQEERDAQAKTRAHVEVNIPDSSEIVKKNLETAKNAGKR